MDSKQFKEYKAVIEEAIRQADLTENVSILHSNIPHDTAIFLTTTRSRDCILMVEGAIIHVLQRVRGTTPEAALTFKTCDVINLAEPGSILQLGVAIKDLLNFSYWSKSDELG